MEHQELVHTETQEGFAINLYVLPEYDSPFWLDDEEEQAELMDKIERGILVYFCAKVTASKAGVELGTDYLGSCCYESLKQFIADDYYVEMKSTAISEANAKIQELTK